MDYARNLLGKPAISAAVAAVSLPALIGSNEGNFDYGGRKIPTWALGAGLGAVSSFGTEFVSNLLLPYVSANQKVRHLESLVLHLGSSGLMFAAIPKLLNSGVSMNDARKLFLGGALSEIVSQWVYSEFIYSEPMPIL